MPIIKTNFKSPLYLTGLGFIVVSFFIFSLPVIFPRSSGFNSLGVFAVNFVFVLVYFFLLMRRGKLKSGSGGLHHFFIFLILFLISAYALNREMVIFEHSVLWFYTLVIGVSVNYLFFVIFDKLPPLAKFLVCMIAGVAMVVFTYLACYLLPVYLVGIAAFFALGISLHTFVPILFCIFTIVLLKRQCRQSKKYWVPFSLGILLPLAFMIVHVFSWNNNQRIVNEVYRYADITENNQLPSWIRVAQRLAKNEQTEKILKTDLVYTVPHLGQRNWFWNLPGSNFEAKVHDPLVVTSAFFSGPVYVPVNDRVKILETLYDSRHQAEERLWSGDGLTTESIVTNVAIWPAFRIAYSELNIIVGHNADVSSRRGRHEAIYTFHLSEGSVVTSLSLWINGVEEKGYLTTKSKADSAYKTIVGVESRDPSVVHWQEGNTVSVRVFPIMNGQSRRFKIGVTSPLIFSNGNLKYNNIYFNGPSATTTQEEVAIELLGNSSVSMLPRGFVQKGDKLLKSKGHYTADWSIVLPAPPLSADAFNFGNYAYSLKPMTQKAVPFEPTKVYLDVNASWTLEECKTIMQLLKDKKVYVASGTERLTKLTDSNRETLLEELGKSNFSLFPFYKMDTSAATLVISKTAYLSPTIDDIRNSAYLEATRNYFASGKKVMVFNLGKEQSPFLKSLKEFRMLHYDQGDLDKLRSLLEANIFNITTENDNEIPIYDAGIAIHRSATVDSGKGPDHLMRLYAYNHILQQSGALILDDKLFEEGLIAEAQEANVVSPFSSLVVLETQKDYDKFDITASKNSLQNASLKSSGAVPEPHEWALILMVVAFVTIVKLRPELLTIKANGKNNSY